MSELSRLSYSTQNIKSMQDFVNTRHSGVTVAVEDKNDNLLIDSNEITLSDSSIDLNAEIEAYQNYLQLVVAVANRFPKTPENIEGFKRFAAEQNEGVELNIWIADADDDSIVTVGEIIIKNQESGKNMALDEVESLVLAFKDKYSRIPVDSQAELIQQIISKLGVKPEDVTVLIDDMDKNSYIDPKDVIVIDKKTNEDLDVSNIINEFRLTAGVPVVYDEPASGEAEEVTEAIEPLVWTEDNKKELEKFIKKRYGDIGVNAIQMRLQLMILPFQLIWQMKLSYFKKI